MNLKTITLACAICAILELCIRIVWQLINSNVIEYNPSISILGTIVSVLLWISMGSFFYIVYKNQK